ncbi:MAG: hypothetical protein ACO39G_08560 [Flavobacteriaceae bacterium]
MTIDEMLNELTSVRQQLVTLLDQEKELKRTKDMLETQIATSLKEQGIDRVGNDQCTVSIKQEIVPTVEDWDALHRHILDTQQFELLQKRMSATAYRELLQMGQAVPGVTSTELTRINFRSK